jgi:hypothetical protein
MILRMRRYLPLLRPVCLLQVLVATLIVPIKAALAADAPKVEITSRVPDEGTVHVIGFLEGTNLKSAGIFDHGEKLKDIEVTGTPGSQRINFNFAIEAPTPSMMIEVTDAMGQSASAMVMAAGTGASPPPSESPLGVGPSSAGEEASPPPPAPGDSGNAIEIPRYGGGTSSRPPNPRFVGGVGNPMSNAEISVMSVVPVMSRPGSYEVTGQIAGAGVRRAGIYVNGRPVKPIPVAAGTFSPFDVVFPLVGGRDATIRAYGAGNQYVELPINLNGPAAMYPNPSGMPRGPLVNPYGAVP